MTEHQLKIEIEQLKKNIFSDDREIMKHAVDGLAKIGGDEIVGFLISLITLDDSGIRNRAALALKDIKDNKAVEPLFNAIFKRENHNNNGTLVYALESLDCRQNLKEIFKILFYETYESKVSDLTILSEQIFDYSGNDLVEIQNMWEDCKQQPNKCPGYGDFSTRGMMQDAIDTFTSTTDQKLGK